MKCRLARRAGFEEIYLHERTTLWSGGGEQSDVTHADGTNGSAQTPHIEFGRRRLRRRIVREPCPFRRNIGAPGGCARLCSHSSFPSSKTTLTIDSGGLFARFSSVCRTHRYTFGGTTAIVCCGQKIQHRKPAFRSWFFCEEIHHISYQSSQSISSNQEGRSVVKRVLASFLPAVPETRHTTDSKYLVR